MSNNACVLCLEQNNAVERIQSHSNCGCEISVHRNCYDQYINRTIDALCLYCRRTSRTNVAVDRGRREVNNITDDIIYRIQNIQNRLINNNNIIINELENIQNIMNNFVNN